MGTSNSHDRDSEVMDFKISSLPGWELQKERELEDQVARTIRSLLNLLRPVYKYVAEPLQMSFKVVRKDEKCSGFSAPSSYKAVCLGDGFLGGDDSRETLFLDLNRSGAFFSATRCDAGGAVHYHFSVDRSCLHLPIGRLVTALREVFERAVDKRVKHLASLEKIARKLDAALEALKK